MSVVMIMNWKGVTPEQYDKARELVNWEGDVPPGARHHVAAFDDQGIRVVDLWDSAEQFQQFVESRLMPGVAEVGIEGQPDVEIYPAHRIFDPEKVARR